MAEQKITSVAVGVWLLFSLIMIGAGAHASESPAPGVLFEKGVNVDDLGPFLSYGFEEDDPLTWQQAQQSLSWKNIGDSSLNFGFAKPPLWLRFDVESSEDVSAFRWLYLPYFALNVMDVFVIEKGVETSHLKAGFNFPFNERAYLHRNYQFPIEVSGPATVMMRVEVTGAMYVPLELWERDLIADRRANNHLLYGAYCGIIFAMILYNLFLFSAIHERLYLVYIGYVASYFMLMMTNEGFSFQYLWPNSPTFNTSASPLFACITGFIALLFSVEFLEVKRYSHAFDRILKGAMGVCVFLAILSLSISYDLNFIVNSLSLLFTFVIVAASIYCYRQGCAQAFYFMLAWIFLLAGIFVFASVMNGLLPSNVVTRHALLLGSVAEVLMFSFALANRINVIKAEKSMVMELQKQSLNGLKQAEMEIYEAAFKDRLTGLPNREQMTRHFNKRAGTDYQSERMHLVIIHLKQLQDINKALGYRVGDALLIKVALMLRQQAEMWLKSPDLEVFYNPEKDLGALEGANFVMVVKAISDVMLEKLCQRILQAFEQPIDYEDMSVDVGVCIGYSPLTEKAKDFDGLLKNAQVAVEAALEKSLGFICYSENLDPYSEKRITLLSDLREAIKQDELKLFLQPKLSLLDQSIKGFEALIRWYHPKHGYVSPEEFIPLAEKSGVINEVTEWVILKAVTYIQFFNERSLYPHISVNISAKNLQQPFFAQNVIQMLKRKEIEPSSIVLEITETAMMDDPDKALACLHHLKLNGFKVSLDDFGTGYSSLSYLSRLPISEIKVDRSFVKDIELQETPVIVETTLQMAKGLGLTTVAEGIENEDALVRLEALGCDLAQGYYVAKPMAFEDVIEWLSDQQGYESLRFHRAQRDSGTDQ